MMENQQNPDVWRGEYVEGDELEKDGSKKKGKGKATYGQPVLDFYGNANPNTV